MLQSIALAFLVGVSWIGSFGVLFQARIAKGIGNRVQGKTGFKEEGSV